VAHEEIGDMEAERVRLRQAVPTDEIGGQALRLGRLSSTQLEEMASVPQSPRVQAEECDEHHRVLTQWHERVLDLRAAASLSPKLTTVAASSARFEQ